MAKAGAEAVNDVPLLPFELGGKADTEDTAEEGLFDFLGSEPEFSDEEESDEDDEQSGDDESDEDDDAAGDADEEDVDDSESDEEDDESAEDDSDEEDDEDDTVEVKIDGKKVRVTLDELKAGYSRQSDYTRKTQALAAEKDAAAKERGELRTSVETYAKNLELLEGVLKNLAGEEPDWEKVKEEEPDEFPKLYADYQLRKQKLDQIAKERQRAEGEVRTQAEKDFKEHLVSEGKLLVKAIPEFADKKKATAGIQKIADYAKETYGFSDEDMANVSDHRILVMLNKAMKHDALTGGRKKLKNKAKNKPVIKPGGRRISTTAKGAQLSKARKSAAARAAKSGSVRDAAAAFELFDL
jgi:hypothetical protein